MKQRIRSLVLVAVLGATFPTLAGAQTQQDYTAANFIAIQCAIDSGGSAESYMEYGHALAKTIATLSDEQFERVFEDTQVVSPSFSIPFAGGSDIAGGGQIPGIGESANVGEDATDQGGGETSNNPAGEPAPEEQEEQETDSGGETELGGGGSSGAVGYSAGDGVNGSSDTPLDPTIGTIGGLTPTSPASSEGNTVAGTETVGNAGTDESSTASATGESGDSSSGRTRRSFRELLRAFAERVIDAMQQLQGIE